MSPNERLDRLKYYRENTNWEIKTDRLKLLRRLDCLISNWKGQLLNFQDNFRNEKNECLNLKDIFRAEEIECLLSDSVELIDKDKEDDNKIAVQFIKFVANSGYKNEPDVDTNGRPKSNVTTPVHLANECKCPANKVRVLHELFTIYHRFDVNYISQRGLAHFHVACMSSIGSVVEKFLKLGRDPNCLVPGTGDSLLHEALKNERAIVAELLLNHGADPNLANDEGSTALHIICKRARCSFVEAFFEICDKKNQPIQVNARDELGRTPLQWAVANLSPYIVIILLLRGADLSSFVFPTADRFNERLRPNRHEPVHNFKLRLAAGALIIVNFLVSSGYELNRTNALRIMKFFSEYELFEMSADTGESWYDQEEFAGIAKEMMIKDGDSGLSLYDLIRLRPKQAAKLFTYYDYYELSIMDWRFPESYRDTCAVHLCEKLSRGFFCYWAENPFLELTNYRFPNLCSGMITEELRNKDLYNICLAATKQSS